MTSSGSLGWFVQTRTRVLRPDTSSRSTCRPPTSAIVTAPDGVSRLPSKAGRLLGATSRDCPSITAVGLSANVKQLTAIHEGVDQIDDPRVILGVGPPP